MTTNTHPTPARAANVPRCTNCHVYMPTLLAKEAVRFCGPDCCHEWSAKMIGATDVHEAFEILNYLRDFFRASLARQGEMTALARLIMASMHMMRELPLEQLLPASVAIQAMEEKAVDRDLEFP